jgi:hypothetical protein
MIKDIKPVKAVIDDMVASAEAIISRLAKDTTGG